MINDDASTVKAKARIKFQQAWNGRTLTILKLQPDCWNSTSEGSLETLALRIVLSLSSMTTTLPRRSGLTSAMTMQVFRHSEGADDQSVDGLPAPRQTLRTARAIRKLLRKVAGEGGAVAHQLAPSGRAVVRLVKATVLCAVLASLALTAAMLWALYDVPLEKRAGFDSPSLLVEAANGQPLGRVGPVGDAVGHRDFPDRLVKAVLSIEDRRFYSHWGIDPWSIVRATHANWTAGTIVEGGSTITQQLAKMQIVGNERTLDRKIREAFTAIWLDLRLGKNEVLTRYLNAVYLGAGAHGMSAAARMYFDKGLTDLTLPEAAMLAGLIQAPSRYDPIRNLDAAQRRAAVVIDTMLESGAIDARAAEKAKLEPASLRLSARTTRAGSWFADWIAKHELPRIAGSVKRAMRVRTTLQPDLQHLAEHVVNEVLVHSGEARGASQAALVALRPDGSVVAMVGGRDYTQSQFNRAVDALRQPGSAFKLFVYYAALRNGYSPDDTIDASAVEVGKWRPENYGGQQYGHMSLSQAFSHSVNSAAIRLSMAVGLNKVVAAARELGLDAPLTVVPSMALGTNEVSLLDLTGAFASVRAGRPRLEPWGIAAFGQEGSGLRSLSAPSGSTQELPHHRELSRLLTAVVDRGTGRAAALDDGDVAGKTGTSQDYRDAWFIGFNKDLVVGVWVGNDDRTSMKAVTGGSLPAQIWKRFVSAAVPLIDRMSNPVVAESARSASPVPAQETQCDQSACAAAYRSFQQSDCTYQPYAGPRRLCKKGVPREHRTVDGNEKGPTRGADAALAAKDRAVEEAIPSIDSSSAMAPPPAQRSRRPEGSMALGRVPPTSAPPRPSGQYGSFGPALFQRLDQQGGN
jgi:penicillin-binding protein 1A